MPQEKHAQGLNRAAAAEDDPGFERLVDSAFRAVVALDPVRASWLGIRGRHDGQLPDHSASGAAAEVRVLGDLIKRFERTDPRRLSVSQQVDTALARGYLATRITMLERRPAWQIMPQIYTRDAVMGLYVHVLRAYAPPSVRARPILNRLRAIPACLDRARENLDNPPAVFTETALLCGKGMDDFLRVTLGSFVEQVDDAGLRRECERANAEAIRSVRNYREFLQSDLMPRSQGDFRIGKPAFNRLLRERHMIPFDSDELVVLGEKVYHETLRAVRAAAARVQPGQNWSRLLQQLKQDHPAEDRLVEEYAAVIRDSRRFVDERGLVSSVPGESLVVVATPGFGRPLHPYSWYLGPGPFDEDQVGTFWVTPPDPSEPPERREAALEGHSRHNIQVLAIHDAYPGHHLQLAWANRHPRPLRHLFRSSFFSEGWALYCEELLCRDGFEAQAQEVVLHQLRDELWRACRVIVDVGLHTGKMSFNEAVSFLVRKAKLERLNAISEVRRHCENPTQGASYTVGKLLINELRDDYLAMRGSDVPLREFHDDLLSHGTLPLELVRREMGVPRRAGDKEILRALTRPPRSPRVPRPPRVRNDDSTPPGGEVSARRASSD